MIARCLALIGLCVLTGCAVHRYNNCAVVNVHDSHGIHTTFADTEQLSEATDQQKRLNDVGNPDISLPVTP